MPLVETARPCLGVGGKAVSDSAEGQGTQKARGGGGWVGREACSAVSPGSRPPRSAAHQLVAVMGSDEQQRCSCW